MFCYLIPFLFLEIQITGAKNSKHKNGLAYNHHCRANQLTGFYMMATLAFNELIPTFFIILYFHKNFLPVLFYIQYIYALTAVIQVLNTTKKCFICFNLICLNCLGLKSPPRLKTVQE